MTRTTDSHAFISYVREDSARVDRLQAILEAAGVRVWRDTADLWPGEDWRGRIRQAITKDALAFIACFSVHSEARLVSGQNEELNLAVEQLRLRRPDQPWLIPVRFDDIDLPDIDVGGGRTVNSIQRADLIEDAWDRGAARLVAAVLRILDRQPSGAALPASPMSIQTQLKAALRDPSGDIALNDLLIPVANEANSKISSDQLFQSSSDALCGAEADAAIYVVGLIDECLDAMNPALDALVTTAQWVRDDQVRTLTRFAEHLIPKDAGGSGTVPLANLRWFPLLIAVYAGALGALHRRNYVSLKSIVLDAHVRDIQDGRVPFIARAHPARPFRSFEIVPQALAYRASGEDLDRELVGDLRTSRRGKRYTPVSDYLHEAMRDKFRADLPDDEEYSELFDRAEAILAILAIDVRQNSGRTDMHYFDPPYFGRFIWRDRQVSSDDGIAGAFTRELDDHNEQWAPLRAGLFGGSLQRAKVALQDFKLGVDESRRGF